MGDDLFEPHCQRCGIPMALHDYDENWMPQCPKDQEDA